MFGRFFARRPAPPSPPVCKPALADNDERLSPHPTQPDQWERVSSEQWLKPDFISQRDSRIAKNPQYYDYCRELVATLFKKHPGIITQPVAAVSGADDPWTYFFHSAVVRWILLLPSGVPDRQRYCNCLAVCLNLPGFDTDDEIEDFVNRHQSHGAYPKKNPSDPFLAISDFSATGRQYKYSQQRLWIRAVPVLRATRNRTFLRGKPLECCDDYDEPHFIHNLRAINPKSLPPTLASEWSDGHIAWLDSAAFHSFLSHWATTTPISATDVPYGEPNSATDQDSWLAGGFAELCKACGNTYYDKGDASCSLCGCRADDPDAIAQYVSSRKHAKWVLGDLKKGVALELQQIEEARRRAEEARQRDEAEQLQQQRKILAEQRKAEEKNKERLRLEREKHNALSQMASATETIAVLRRRLSEISLEDGLSRDAEREACLRKLCDAIAEYEAASESYERCQAEINVEEQD